MTAASGTYPRSRTDNAPPTPPSSSSIVDSKRRSPPASIPSESSASYCYQGRCEPSFHVCAAAAVEGVSSRVSDHGSRVHSSSVTSTTSMWPPIARVGPLPPSTRAATFDALRPAFVRGSLKVSFVVCEVVRRRLPDIWLKVHCLKSIVITFPSGASSPVGVVGSFDSTRRLYVLSSVDCFS